MIIAAITPIAFQLSQTMFVKKGNSKRKFSRINRFFPFFLFSIFLRFVRTSIFIFIPPLSFFGNIPKLSIFKKTTFSKGKKKNHPVSLRPFTANPLSILIKFKLLPKTLLYILSRADHIQVFRKFAKVRIVRSRGHCYIVSGWRTRRTMRFQGRERRKDRWIALYIIGFSKGFGSLKLGRRYGDDTWKRGGLAGIIRTKRLI